MPRPWQLDRRTFLRGTGVAAALPFLDAMRLRRPRERARRAVFVSFPNGCSLPDADDAQWSEWRWFPKRPGTDYEFTSVLRCLEPFRDRLSLLGGLSHPLSRELLGHLAGDTWLTAGDLRFDAYKNRVSVDQVAAAALQQHTRYPSLILSTDGGVGYKSRVATLSFDPGGHPIAAESRPRRIFERYFAPDGGGTTGDRRRALQQGQKIVDMVLEDARRLRQQLGSHDQQQLDGYLDSLDRVEQQVRRNEAWLDRPLPAIDAGDLALDARADVDPAVYLRTMYDLIALALETDLVRVVTFQTAREDGMGFGDQFPARALGIQRGYHTISHDTHDGHWHDWGRLDQWNAQQFVHLLERLAGKHDEHGALLDSTMVLYGSCCSTTHNARNLPLALCGGTALGLRHGAYAQFDESVPLCNLFVGMLNALGVPTEQFGDSTGPLPAPPEGTAPGLPTAALPALFG